MQGIGTIPIGDQLRCHLLSAAPCFAENDTIDIGIIIGNPLECQIAIISAHHIVEMTDILINTLFIPHRHLHRLPHKLSYNSTNLLRHCRRKQQKTTLIRDFREDQHNILNKAHIQHLIRLIQYHIFNPLQRDGISSDQVQESPRSSHHHLCSPPHSLYLLLNRGATIDSHDPKVINVDRIARHIPSNLQAELTRRSDNQGLRIPIGTRDILYHRQTKSSRLTTTCLR
ncbi:Uncharacterised protein [Chlamydia trachomatis]|nr:Uncharacterised protein [Chlamydia trachomatis]